MLTLMALLLGTLLGLGLAAIANPYRNCETVAGSGYGTQPPSRLVLRCTP
jgi:hypothetical protein